MSEQVEKATTHTLNTYVSLTLPLTPFWDHRTSRTKMKSAGNKTELFHNQAGRKISPPIRQGNFICIAQQFVSKGFT